MVCVSSNTFEGTVAQNKIIPKNGYNICIDFGSKSGLQQQHKQKQKI